MCYRAAFDFTPTELTEALSFPWEDQRGWEQLPYISGFLYPELPFVANDRPQLISHATWGLVPYWAKPEKVGDLRKMLLNARSETAREKASFKHLIYRKRGLLPVSGFIEWRHNTAKDKQPYYVRSSAHSIMTLGCLWDEWTDKVSGETLRTFTVLTTRANELMQYVHNSKERQPVIIADNLRHAWLAEATPADVQEMMLPIPSGDLEAVPIAKTANTSHHTKEPTALDPIGDVVRL